MRVQDLLKQALVEHDALESKYNKVVAENELLRACSTSPQATDFATAASHQKLMSAEVLHGAPPSPVILGGGDVGNLAGLHHTESDLRRHDARLTSLPNTNLRASFTAHASANEYREFEIKRGGAESEVRQRNGSLRKKFMVGLMNPYADLVIGVITVSNVVVMWIEADIRAGGSEPGWSTAVNLFYLLLYSVEFGVRCFVFRSSTFLSQWNKLDFAIIFLDCWLLVLSALLQKTLSAGGGILRLVRLCRVVRIFKVFRCAHELQLLIHGFVGAAKAVGYASIMLWMSILMWSFAYVEAIHPIVKEMTEAGMFESCFECQQGYSTVFQAQIRLLQQVVASDDWGKVSIEVINYQKWTLLIFGGALISIQLGLMNLVLTVIVDAASRAKQENLQLKIDTKELAYRNLKKSLTNMCKEMDLDGSGELSLDELIDGYKSNMEFGTLMASLDITEKEMSQIFKCMDEDRSGTVSYAEFVNSLYKLKCEDLESVLFFMKGLLYDLRAQLREDMDTAKRERRGTNMLMEQQLAELSQLNRRSGREDSITAEDSLSPKSPKSPNAKRSSSEITTENETLDNALLPSDWPAAEIEQTLANRRDTLMTPARTKVSRAGLQAKHGFLDMIDAS